MANLMYDDGVIELHVQGDPNRPFRFNPEDPRLYEGFLSMVENLQAKADEFTKEAANVDDRELSSEEFAKETASLMVKQDRELREELDKVFGEGSSQILFGDISATAVGDNGDYIFCNMLMKLYPFFERGHEKHKEKLDKVIEEKRPSRGKKNAIPTEEA